MFLVSLALTLAVEAAPPPPAPKALPPAEKTTARARHRQPLMERSVNGGPVQAVLPANGKPKL